MRRSSLLLATVLLLAPATLATAQETGFDQSGPEHELLERLSGEWRFERYSVPTDGSEPQLLGSGTISAKMIGSFFVVSRWSGSVYDFDYAGVQSLGYDADRQAYSGDWIDSFLDYRWELEGSVDPASGGLTLATSGPSPTGETGNFRERYSFDSPDSLTILGEMQEGERWTAITRTEVTRQR